MHFFIIYLGVCVQNGHVDRLEVKKIQLQYLLKNADFVLYFGKVFLKRIVAVSNIRK